MPEFTVTAVSDQIRDYDTDYGPKKAYRIHLRNGDGSEHLNIELRRNADSPAPTVGQQLEGDLVDQGKYGQRLQLAQRGGAGGVYSAPGGVYSGTRPEDPQRQKRIVRQHSQAMALQALALRYRPSDLHAMTPERLFELIAKTTDWFDNDVQRAAS